MSHSQVIEQLKTSLQTAYRQSVDADARLDELQKAGHAKFNTIFSKDEGFSTSSNRFLPYMQELVDEMEALPVETDEFPAALEVHLRKLALMLQTIQAFKSNAK